MIRRPLLALLAALFALPAPAWAGWTQVSTSGPTATDVVTYATASGCFLGAANTTTRTDAVTYYVPPSTVTKSTPAAPATATFHGISLLGALGNADQAIIGYGYWTQAAGDVTGWGHQKSAISSFSWSEVDDHLGAFAVGGSASPSIVSGQQYDGCGIDWAGSGTGFATLDKPYSLGQFTTVFEPSFSFAITSGTKIQEDACAATSVIDGKIISGVMVSSTHYSCACVGTSGGIAVGRYTNTPTLSFDGTATASSITPTILRTSVTDGTRAVATGFDGTNTLVAYGTTGIAVSSTDLRPYYDGSFRWLDASTGNGYVYSGGNIVTESARNLAVGGSTVSAVCVLAGGTTPYAFTADGKIWSYSSSVGAPGRYPTGSMPRPAPGRRR